VPPLQAGLEHTARGVQCLAEAVERGLRVHIWPQDVDDLLTVQRMPGVRR